MEFEFQYFKNYGCITSVDKLILELGLEPCNYIHGFIQFYIKEKRPSLVFLNIPQLERQGADL